jgi:hypothetical protein
MDIIKSALSLCAKIYEMYGKFTSNQKKCEWLLSIVESIEKSLNLQLQRDAVPGTLMLPLVQLQQDLQSCETILREFGLCSDLKKFAFGNKHEEQFQQSGFRLFTSHATFSHLLTAQLLLDQRDAAAYRDSQMSFKVDLILHALQHAEQRDVLQHEEDLQGAIQDPQMSQKPEEFGILSSTGTRLQPFAPTSLGPAPAAAAVVTFESAQSCSWYAECHYS